MHAKPVWLRACWQMLLSLVWLSAVALCSGSYESLHNAGLRHLRDREYENATSAFREALRSRDEADTRRLLADATLLGAIEGSEAACGGDGAHLRRAVAQSSVASASRRRVSASSRERSASRKAEVAFSYSRSRRCRRPALWRLS